MRLYHFTCAHGRAGIRHDGEFIIPQIKHPFLNATISWFTTESAPDREATGLTNRYTDCDRMVFRYQIPAREHHKCRRWLTSPERSNAPSDFVEDLEAFGDPEHWWIADVAVKARLA